MELELGTFSSILLLLLYIIRIRSLVQPIKIKIIKSNFKNNIHFSNLINNVDLRVFFLQDLISLLLWLVFFSSLFLRKSSKRFYFHLIEILGNGVAGVIVGAIRIITKLSLHNTPQGPSSFLSRIFI